MPSRTIIVFGSGPGIGNHVASEFVSNGFDHAILLARNTSRLEEDKAQVAKANSSAQIDTVRLDLNDLSSIPAVLKQIEQLGGEIEVVLFNAARIKGSAPLEVPVEEIEEDFRVTNLALYIIAQWAIPRLQTLATSNPSAKPSFFVTNSHLPWDPMPQLLSLSLIKASQRNMVMSFQRAFGSTGVHFGLVNVEGIVEPQKKYLNPINIAQKTFEYYDAGKELDLSIKEL